MGGTRVGIMAAVVAAASTFACGSDNDEGQGPNQELIDIYRALGHASCHQWFECCPAGAIRAEQIGTSEADCIRKQEELLPAAPFLYRESLASGRTAFHAGQARACLRAIESATCTTPEALIDCDFYPIFEPRVLPGQACAWGHECIGGFCDRDFEAGADFGKCIAKAANGTPCSASQECSSGLCKFEPSGSRCADLGAVGEDCVFGTECASGKCACEMPAPGQVSCAGTTGACGPPPPENGCTLD